jgi:glycogen operon protein
VLWRIDGSAIGERDFLLCVNMDHAEAAFTLPPPPDGGAWRRLVDTAAWAEPFGNAWMFERADRMGAEYVVHPYSVVVFQEGP